MKTDYTRVKRLKQLLTIILFFSTCTLFAQQRVALQSNGTTTIFAGANPFTDAYNAAANGDTLYLPGGTFAATSVMNKRVVVYGTGHHPDSSAVMGETIITRQIYIDTGAAKSRFEGIKFSDGISYRDIADSVVIKRCYLTSIHFGSKASVGTQIIENVIVGSIVGTGSVNTVIANNIIKAGYNVFYNFANQAWIRNNIIVGSGYLASGYMERYVFNEITDCLFDNNIIFNESTRINNVLSSSVSNNTFKNNVFNANPDLSLNTWENNYFDVVSSTVFTNYTGLIFDYAEDFHLVDPASYLGTTGNEVGIYGGFTPAKVGMIPGNPHFQFKSIAPATDENGDLQIQIQVKAQYE